MKNLSIVLGLAAAATLFAPSSTAQCGGQGNLVLEFISVQNSGTVPGSDVTLRITGQPNEYICFACDTGAGPVTLGNLGTVCVDLGPNLIEFVFPLPPSGVIELTGFLPNELLGTVLCCQAIGIEAVNPLFLGISNGVCFTVEPTCTSGGLEWISHQSKFENITSFPVVITSQVTGSAGGNGSPATSLNYDPQNPPSFPVATTSPVVIENVAKIGDDIYVTTRVQATETFRKAGNNLRLPNELDFSVTVGNANHFQPAVHVSCSQPIGVGMIFGDFLITGVGTRH